MASRDELNPYAEPRAVEKKRPKKKAQGAERDPAMDALQESFRRTRPWISFFTVLGYIGAGALVLLGILTVVTPTRGPVNEYRTLLLFVYLAAAVIYSFISARLGRYRESIDDVLRSDGELHLVALAIERQREFWALVGWVTIVAMSIYGLVIASAVLMYLGR
jgi:hypothetical protein